MAYSCVNSQEPLASVIVPAYNVEGYIRECIESIQRQSVEEIEIIAVDDGSTDGSGKILDGLSTDDGRLKVIHKENAGVSAARNSGIDAAKGKYIVFVDGDDFLAPDFLAYMIGLVERYGSEFCLSLNCFTKKNEEQITEDKVEQLDNVGATALLLSPRVIVGCWDKIFSREFINANNIRFRTDLHYGEGLHFITTVSQRANHVTVGERKVYYYRRDNQYSATTKFNIESILNGEKAIDLIEEQLIVDGNTVRNMLLLHRSMYNMGALVRVKTHHKEKEYESDYKRWRTYIHSHIVQLFKCKDIPIYRKVLITGGCVSPWVMSKLDTVRRKRIADRSVSK